MTPGPYQESSGLTAFVIERHDAQQVSKILREKWAIYTRVIPHYNSMRIATAHFNSTEDVDALMRGWTKSPGHKQFREIDCERVGWSGACLTSPPVSRYLPWYSLIWLELL